MLLSTFQHLKGVGTKKERDLWRSGIISWKDLELAKETQLSIFAGDPNKSKETLLSLSWKALEEEDAEFFAKCLARQEHYRIALSFPSKTLFLDIETTGLSRYYDTITIIGWSMDGKYGVHIKGDSDSSLRKVLLNAKAIVTFNGSLFDLPFIRQEFQDLQIPTTHIDLRFLARRVGLSGGQKKIEKQLGVIRPEHLLNLEGETAPLLWHKYRRGDLNSLKLLISYNHADVEGMKQIFDTVIDRLMQQKQVPLLECSTYCFSAHPSELKLSTDKEKTPNTGIELHPYRGTTGPAISFKDLAVASDNSRLQIVGIDLTGSEARASGWCLIDGDNALTKRIHSDADIIKATLDANPDLVSIDSPLSLPEGRVTVSDSDLGRTEYGITRYCERALKKRGVNVYPCLIRSMQGLTARGIRLAARFRSLGVPVIESYPGAAQDIMSIPRKRASLEFLRSGLAEFGLKGEFLKTPVSHDELDAITSAFVGLFFWGGRFEALGNDQEGYLIIPDVDISKNMCKGRRVIGFSGLIASGKTTAGEFLKSHGFQYGRFSLVLADILRDRGITPSRETLQQIGEEVNKNPGQRWLCQQLVRKLPQQGNLVIDGLRFPEDHAFLVEAFGSAFLHIHINVPKEVRLERYVSNGGDYEEFARANSHPVEESISQLASLAHVVISNTGTLESFLSKLTHTVGCEKNTRGESFACL